MRGSLTQAIRDRLIAAGFDEVGVARPDGAPETAQRLVRIAKERGLLMSGGSDFHGFEGRESLGEPPVPYEFFASIKERLGDRAA